jgi:hypothetical protein
MSSRMRTIARLAAATASAGALSLGGVAAASATAGHLGSAGTESFLIAIANTHQSVIAHGVFVGAGLDDASHDNFDVLHLGGGTVRINHPDSQSHFTQHINPKTCYGTFTITGKYTLSRGTGRLKGVRGHGHKKVYPQGVQGPTKSGASAVSTS